MPKPKGPEKKYIGFRVTVPTFEWLQRKAGGKPVPTYLAETVERQADVAAKNEVTSRFKGEKK
jgi:hypothetical protein